MPDPLKERISLLTMGEAQGKLRPEHQAELERYRASGLAKGNAPGAPAPVAGGQLETAAARDKAKAAMLIIERLQPQINRVRQLQKTAMAGKGLAGLKEYNPFRAENNEYDAAVAQLKSLARPATRTAGEGAQSDFESKLAVAPLPGRWKLDSYNDEAVNGLQSLVDTSRTLYGSQLGLPAAPPRRADAKAALKAKYGLK